MFLVVALGFSCALNAQSLKYHQEELSLDGTSITYKALSRQLKESGDLELAKQFRRIHRRRENTEPGWLGMGITSYTIGLWELMIERPNWFSGTTAAVGLGILLMDDQRQKKTERLIESAVERYQTKYGSGALAP